MAVFRSLLAQRQLRQMYKLSCAKLIGCPYQNNMTVTSTKSLYVKLENAQMYGCQMRSLCSAQHQITPRRNYCSEADKHKTEVTYGELLALLESDDVQLFDVREPKEIEETGTIPSATNIPLTRVKEALTMDEVKFTENFGVSHPDKYDRNIVFFGLGPIKSTAALELAFKLGYKKARHYPGGWTEWSKKYKAK